jgi:hypothetical protein
MVEGHLQIGKGFHVAGSGRCQLGTAGGRNAVAPLLIVSDALSS